MLRISGSLNTGQSTVSTTGGTFCPCGKKFGFCDGGCWIPPLYPQYPAHASQPVRLGWKCPNCGKGVNPDEKTCPCCISFTVTGQVQIDGK